jgi:hypothetical protein
VRSHGGAVRGSVRSVEHLDGCDRHQVFHRIGELPVDRDQRVGVGAGSGRRTRRQCVRPPEQDGGLPHDLLEHAVAQQPDPQPSHVAKLSLGILPGHLVAASCLVEQRQHLGAQQRRGQDLMAATDRGLVVSQADDDIRADHVPWSWKIVSPRLLSRGAPAPEYGDAWPAYRPHAGARMHGSYIGSVRVHGDHRSAPALADAAGQLHTYGSSVAQTLILVLSFAGA